MKTILSIILVFSLTHILAQDITFPAGTEPIEIVAKLFEGEIDHYEGVCVWKPNLAEKLQFNEDDDGFLYTQIDSVFVYENNQIQNMLIVTYTKDHLDQSCFACDPAMSVIELKFDKIDNVYRLKGFYKYVDRYGSWGHPGELDLLKIADGIYCIQNTDSDGKYGFFTIGVTLYYKGKNILSFISHNDNKGDGSELRDKYEYNTAMLVYSNKGEIFLYKKGTELNKKDKAIVVNEITGYEFRNNEFIETSKIKLKKHIPAQDITFPSGTKPIEMVSKLFKGKINEQGVCVWKPNLAEKRQFRLTDDSLLYTQMDTAFVYEINRIQNMLIVTYTKDHLDQSSHGSVPIMSVIKLKFSKNDSVYQLNAFYKYVDGCGDWSRLSKVDLLKVAEDISCIKASDSEVGASTPITTFPLGTKPIEIVSNLFKGRINSQGVCVWKPNTERDKRQFGYRTVYTKLDTVFVYTPRGSRNTLIVIHSIDFILANLGGSPIMSAIELAPDNNTYKVKAFYKYIDRNGSWEHPADIDLLKIDYGIYCITARESNISEGVTTGTTTLYYNGCFTVYKS